MNIGMKIAAAILCVALALTGAGSAVAEEKPGVSAACAAVVDADTKTVLYDKDSQKPMLIASTTKIMTALVVLEHCKMDETVEIVSQYTGIEGSSVYLEEGERLTVEELLYCLMLKSGNDAAVALACYTAGSVEEFADLMNEKAEQLGCKDSFFENPHGLDGENHHSCAYDLAVITACAMENSDFCRIVATKSTTAAGRYMTNHNKLLNMYDGAVGVKTGYTMAAGRILVSAAKRDGHTLIAVTINAPDDWNDHIRLLDYVFSMYEEHMLCTKGAVAYTLPVIGGCTGEATITYSNTLTCSMIKGETVESELFLPRFLYGGIKRGETVGYVEYTLSNGEKMRCNLICSTAIAIAVPDDFWTRVAAFG